MSGEGTTLGQPEPTPEYTVIGSGVSPFVRKVALLLLEKGVPFELENLNPYAPPEGFRSLSPLGRIPVLRHGERVVNDSSVICHYLERLHPEPSLYPADPFDCARAEWIEEYVDGGLQPVGSRIFQPLVLGPLVTGKPADETEPRRLIAEELPAFFQYLDDQVGDSGYYVGEVLSIADLTVASLFVNLRLAGVLPDAARFPRLVGFLQHMHARDSFAAAVEPLLPIFGRRWVEFE